MKNLLLNKEIPSSADYAVVAYDSKEGKVSSKGGSQPTPPQPTFEYVDLGLPSGLKWAKCNVGATSEEEYGKYFQWGDVEGITADEISSKPCSWPTAPFNNGSNDYNGTYFASVSGTVCPNGVLAKEYDAVYQATNGKAHMPTEADLKELTANTISAWTTVNGVQGVKFTSKKAGYTDKYIFIPAAGNATNSSMFDIDSCANVWSNSLNTSNPFYAFALKFDSGSVYSIDIYSRYRGFSVRGVLE